MTEDWAGSYEDIWYDQPRRPEALRARLRGARRLALLPVLCMHGLTRNSKDFAWIAAHLARTRRVISVDQRGRGLSAYDPVAANYTPATYVQDMFKLLDELHLDRVILIGTSMGGLMSMLMANMQPQRLPAIVHQRHRPGARPGGPRSHQGLRRQRPPDTHLG
jgi:pimeloyl-ACP methyl ester carboxylesterase